jgi:uncharacterized repeat protein (TIGR02543 family)
MKMIIFLLSAAVCIDAQTHFAFTSITGNDMTVGVPVSINPTIDGAAPANGDEIGVFTPGGLCVGAVVWNGSNIAISVHGDDDRTTIVDGIAAGEQLLFRVWDASLLKEGTATVAFSSGGPNYSVDGMAVLSLFIAVTLSPSSYMVTYNGNGNTGGMVPTDANNYLQSASVTVLGNTGGLVRTGSTFAGWNTASNGGGTSYNSGATFTVGTANVVLYAQWTLNPTYTVTYNGNGNTGGTVPTDANNYQQDVTVTVLDNTGSLTKTDYTFAGWNTAANGSGTSYNAGATFPMGTSNVILYAQWTSNPTYTVTYNGNGNTSGTVPTDANNYQQSITVTVLGNTGGLTKTGYAFSGWNTAANGSGTSYSAGATFTVETANVVLFAQWTVNTYILTINQAIGQNAPVKIKDTTVTYGDTVHLTAPSVTGCLFVNWRITSGTALLLDSTQSTCRVILFSGNAAITAFYSYAIPVLNTIKKVPTSFGLSYNGKSKTITFAIPKIQGFSGIPVDIRIYDIKGQLLDCLIDKNMGPGYYTASISTQGKTAAGIMIGKMESLGYRSTVKIVSKCAY